MNSSKTPLQKWKKAPSPKMKDKDTTSRFVRRVSFSNRRRMIISMPYCMSRRWRDHVVTTSSLSKWVTTSLTCLPTYNCDPIKILKVRKDCYAFFASHYEQRNFFLRVTEQEKHVILGNLKQHMLKCPY